MGGSIWASCHHEIPYIPMLMARNNIFTMKLVLFFGISIIVIDIRLKFPGGPTICHLYYVKPSLIKVYHVGGLEHEFYDVPFHIWECHLPN